MSEAELDLSYEILDLIYERLGQEGLKDFIKDFKDYCDAIVGDSDSDYEPEESASDSESEIEVEEEYTTEVDNEGFYNLKDCVVIKKK
jgi:hypothetical protein